jgi:hypothetical protein
MCKGQRFRPVEGSFIGNPDMMSIVSRQRPIVGAIRENGEKVHKKWIQNGYKKWKKQDGFFC